MSTDPEIQQLGDELGNFHTHLSPVNTPSDWLCANISNIQSTWEGVSKLSKDDIVGFEKLEKHIYPRLFTYTLAHLKLHANASVLLDFTASLAQWVHFDEITLLRYHRSIKETLWAFQNRSRNNRLNESLNIGARINKLLRLDVLSIATRILAIVNDDQRKRSLLDQQGPQAQTVLDLLQGILDVSDLEIVRPPILRVILELSRRSGLYPASLILQGVDPQGKESVIGGSYGDIWKGTFGRDTVAIKVMRVDPAFVNRSIKVFCKEAIVWRQLHNPHVLPFYGVYQWPGASFRVCLVSPWMMNGNVVQYLKRTPTADRRSLILDISRGLDYLHSFDPPVIHGDLRGTNILVTLDERACIADFGLCTLARDSLPQFTPTSSAYQCTNLLWLAPEFFQYEESGKESPRQSLATDIYSFGCVCYELFAGRPRFSNLHAPFEVVVAVAGDRRPTRPAHEDLDNTMWELIDKCWAKVAASRPTASEVVDYFSSHLATMKKQRFSDEPTFSLPPAVLKKSMMVQDIIVALVGPTGSGKSNFINVATGQSSVFVSDDLASCTQDVQAVSFPHPDGSGRNIIFVDTPGFDDTEKTDFQVLEQIANWMKETYQEHITLTGLLFFHRITDVRMRGTPLRNLTMFEALCGKDALENVILTTTMWDEVHEPTAADREHQLQEDFWAPMMGEGCRMARFHNTFSSAWDVINLLAINSPRALLVQKEMVDQKRELNATSAFKVLVRWWEQVVSKFKSKFRRRIEKQMTK